jgi:multidrug resistance efflux pump
MEPRQRIVESSDTAEANENTDWSAAGFQGFSGFEVARSYDNLPATTRVLVQPAPVTQPRRKKLLVGAIVVIGCLVVAHRVWHAFFRYRAVGTVIGQVTEVSAPEDGVIQAFHVKEGDKVDRGQVILTLDYPLLQARIAQVADEIRIAQADVKSETSRLKWQYVTSENGGNKVIADYDEKMGELLSEQARLEDLALTLQRTVALHRRKAVTDQQLDQARLAERGQREKVKMFQEAVAKLKQRAESVKNTSDDGRAQLESKQSRVEALLAEIARLRERMAGGQIRAPVAGVVVKRLHSAGEQVSRHEELLSILDTDSLEIVLYLPHRSSQFLAPGQQIDVEIEPYSRPVALRVIRLGDQLTAAPEQLQTFYRYHEKLLPVYLKPVDASNQPLALRVGAIVRLPYGTSPQSMGANL